MVAASLARPETQSFASVNPDRGRQASVPRISPVQPSDAAQAEAENRPVVLVAEDHEDSRDAMRTLLDAFGYRVVEAVNGRQAVELAVAEHPDLILMDMMMPLVDGLQATREIRAEPSLAGVPVIALTAMEGARDRVLAAGCDDLVTKPIDVRAFLGRVRGWIESRRQAG
ncbi:response regulator [Longimicrobium terrae]|nr:response regulator [Longimicrobium terrae]NNC32787.1 response regulator [Longimicrobium terrae]